MNLQNIEKLQQLLSDFLNPQIQEVINSYVEKGKDNLYFIEIPEVDVVDLGLDKLASLVARTSNVYGRAARFAGMARANYKLIEGKYKKVYKSSRVGKNEAEREAAAMEAAEAEYSSLVTCEAIVNLAESLESSARIASESARKLMDKVQSMQIASSRESKGYYLEEDFKTY
jgi:hypothetical protein